MAHWQPVSPSNQRVIRPLPFLQSQHPHFKHSTTAHCHSSELRSRMSPLPRPCFLGTLTRTGACSVMFNPFISTRSWSDIDSRVFDPWGRFRQRRRRGTFPLAEVEGQPTREEPTPTNTAGSGPEAGNSTEVVSAVTFTRRALPVCRRIVLSFFGLSYSPLFLPPSLFSVCYIFAGIVLMLPFFFFHFFMTSLGPTSALL